MAENPLASLPAQMHTWKETKALYPKYKLTEPILLTHCWLGSTP